MKKTLSIIMLGAAVASAPIFAACGSSSTDSTTAPENETEITTEATVASGAWTVNTDTKGTLSAGESDVFKAAINNTDKAYLTPVACVGSQIVAGTNYAFLCIDTKSNAWRMITVYNSIYNSIEGASDIIGEYDFDPQNLSVSDGQEHSELVGGWSVQIPESVTLPDDAQKYFDKAMETSDSSSFKPVALLSTQIVAGTNYRFLCTGTSDDQTALYVVDVYADPSGNAEITQSPELSLTDYVGPT